MKLQDHYLDTNLLFGLDKEKADRIFDLYYQMIQSFETNNITSATCYFNTLLKSGYLKNKIEEERGEKLGELING